MCRLICVFLFAYGIKQVFSWCGWVEPEQNKTYKMTWALKKNSDQPKPFHTYNKETKTNQTEQMHTTKALIRLISSGWSESSQCTGLSWPLGSLTPGGQDTRGQLDPRGFKFPGVSSPPPWLSSPPGGEYTVAWASWPPPIFNFLNFEKSKLIIPLWQYVYLSCICGYFNMFKPKG